MQQAISLRGGVPLSDFVIDYTNPILVSPEVAMIISNETSKVISKKFRAAIGTWVDKANLIPHPIELSIMQPSGSVTVSLKNVHR